MAFRFPIAGPCIAGFVGPVESLPRAEIRG